MLLVTSLCPPGYCTSHVTDDSNNPLYHHLPSFKDYGFIDTSVDFLDTSVDFLDTWICSESRTGTLCGSCQKNILYTTTQRNSNAMKVLTATTSAGCFTC